MDIKFKVNRTSVSDTDKGEEFLVTLQFDPTINPGVKPRCNGVLEIIRDSPFDPSLKRGAIVTVSVADKADQ